MEALSKRDKIKAPIATNIIYLITLLDNNGNLALYTGVNIHGIYHYLEMIGNPTTFNTLGYCSNHFGPSSYIKIDTKNIQPAIVSLSLKQRSICEFYGRIGNKSDD